MRDNLSLVVYLIYCIEAGLFLLIVPWHRVWTQNYFLERWVGLWEILRLPAVRGAISGIGIALLLHAVDEIWTHVQFRRARRRADKEVR